MGHQFSIGILLRVLLRGYFLAKCCWKEKLKRKRKNELCDLCLAILKEKGKESRKGCRESRLNVTMERFLPFLSSSAWLCIFGIYIDRASRKRESECLNFFKKSISILIVIIDGCILVINKIKTRQAKFF